MTWKNSLSHDWIPVEKAKTFPLREFYVGLRWVRVVKRAIKYFKEMRLGWIWGIVFFQSNLSMSASGEKGREILKTNKRI